MLNQNRKPKALDIYFPPTQNMLVSPLLWNNQIPPVEGSDDILEFSIALHPCPP